MFPFSQEYQWEYGVHPSCQKTHYSTDSRTRGAHSQIQVAKEKTRDSHICYQKERISDVSSAQVRPWLFLWIE